MAGVSKVSVLTGLLLTNLKESIKPFKFSLVAALVVFIRPISKAPVGLIV